MIQIQPQPTYPVSQEDLALVRELRERCSDVLTQFFDTDFNLLRWIIGWKRDLNVVEPKLRKHLLLRKQLNFDVPVNQLPLNPVVNKYFPEKWIERSTGKTDSVLAVLMDGRLDIEGLCKSVAYNDLVLTRLCYTEMQMRRIMQLEAKHNRRFTISIIVDAEGVKMNSWTWFAVKEIYMNALPIVFENYVEIVDLILILNAGRMAYMAWKVFDAVVPQSTASKVKLLGGNWRTDILNYITEDNLPIFFGGSYSVDNDEYAYKLRKIPEELHYNSDRHDIRPELVSHVTLAHGEWHVIVNNVIEQSLPQVSFRFSFYFRADGVIGFTAYFSESALDEAAIIKFHSSAKTGEINAPIDHIYPHVHLCRATYMPEKGIICPQRKKGFYYFLIKNEAWLFSRNVEYVINIVDE